MCVSCFAVRTRDVTNVTVRWSWSWARCNVTSRYEAGATSFADDARSSRDGDAERSDEPSSSSTWVRGLDGCIRSVRVSKTTLASRCGFARAPMSSPTLGNGDFHGQRGKVAKAWVFPTALGPQSSGSWVVLRHQSVPMRDPLSMPRRRRQRHKRHVSVDQKNHDLVPTK